MPHAAPASPNVVGPEAPLLHRVVAAGQLRYWIIAAWALALATTAPWLWALIWFAVATASGLVRTFVDLKLQIEDPRRKARVKLVVATASGVAWAVAPVLAVQSGDVAGVTLAVALLCAGYVLVFTQMRANLSEALIVSSPYTVATLVVAAHLWGHSGFLTIVAILPVIGLALLIKVTITQIKDNEVASFNARQVELIEALGVAGEQARAASEAKSNFLAVVSHELRTPMNGVLGAAQLLENTTRLDPPQDAYVSIIRRSGESLLVMVNDILDFTKIEAGRMEVAAEDITTADLLNLCVGSFQAQCEIKGLAFDVRTDGDLPHAVTLDARKVVQIVQNLLNNAIKFTGQGRVRVTLSGERLSADRARFALSVADTGVGIAAEDQTRLFQPFTQVDGSSTRGYGGTGLGLSICRRMAHLLGGEIALRSSPGDGSTFTLTLDVAVTAWDAPSTPDDAEPAPAPDSEGLKVLVVEDHPVNRMVLRAWLTSMGHDCATADNGQEGVDAAAAERFDLIIMDINMPVMDGLTAIRRIREGGGPNGDTPIAVLSASARPEDHANGYAAGADAYVDKPVDFSALTQLLDEVPNGRPAVRATAIAQTPA